MIFDRGSAAAWLERLAADRLIKLSPRTVIEVERLLRLLRARNVRDPAEIGHSLASLLAKDPERWRQVLEHFRRTFDPRDAPEMRFASRRGEQAEDERAGEVCSEERPPPRVWGEWLRWLRRRWPAPVASLRRLAQRYRGVTLTAILGVAVSLAILALVIFAGDIEPRLPVAARGGIARVVAPPSPAPLAPPDVAIAVVKNPERYDVLLPPRGTPDASRPSLWEWLSREWRRGLLLLASVLLGALGVRWWFAHRDYARDVEEAERRSEEERARLMDETSTLGVPYHIERVPPLPAGAIDDAATLLGRIARREEGLELDVPPTIDRTIDAGGRIVPVFARGGRRESLLVFVDIESGSHPYLDGVEWVLARWKRLGVPFVRYDYRERPLPLFRHPDHHVTSLDDLGRRAEGMPLLIFSRMALPQEYHGRLGWLRGLDPWPNRALVDLDPRVYDERRKEAQRVWDRVAARIPRYPFTREGLLACAAALAGGGERLRPLQERRLAAASNDPVVKQALQQWAAAACCVPHPSWAHLDSLRRGLVEIAEVLADPRYVQRLIDWVRANGYGEGDPGSGNSLRFSAKARLELLEWLRHEDRARFPDERRAERMEHRARELLIGQLHAADVRNDPFERQKRDMKAAVHEAVLDSAKVEELLKEFADKAVAPELRKLLDEELALQSRMQEHDRTAAALQPGGGWSAGVRDAARAWVGRGGVRLADLARVGRWSARHGVVLASVLAAAAASWGVWWLKPPEWVERLRNPPLPPQLANVLAPAMWEVVPDQRREAEPGHVALADVAPMRFMRLRGGSFLMGSTPEERERFMKQLPQEDRDRKPFEDETLHRAEVGPFEIGMHEVTQKQWHEVMRTTPFECGYGCGDDVPAQNVTWIDAAKFMNALTDRENKSRAAGDKLTRCYDEATWAWARNCTGYRFPTEAEWEFAARAGTTTAYSFGDDLKELCAYGNGADQAAKRKLSFLTVNEQCDDGRVDLAPVGTFKPNRWDLYDMHGNVWEWVWDWYGPYPEHSPVGYAGPTGGEGRVLRGGSFVNVPWRLRSANRFWVTPTLTLVNIGLRCVRGSPPSIGH